MSKVQRYLDAYAQQVMPLRPKSLSMRDEKRDVEYRVTIEMDGDAIISRSSGSDCTRVRIPESVMIELAGWASANYLDEEPTVCPPLR